MARNEGHVNHPEKLTVEEKEEEEEEEAEEQNKDLQVILQNQENDENIDVDEELKKSKKERKEKKRSKRKSSKKKRHRAPVPSFPDDDTPLKVSSHTAVTELSETVVTKRSMITCNITGCDDKFFTPQGLIHHMKGAHRVDLEKKERLNCRMLTTKSWSV